MACGLPIIIRDLPTIRDRVGYGNGLLTDGSTADIAAKMAAVIDDPAARDRMAAASRTASPHASRLSRAPTG
jgi:glycosyltransferase involved in cell wall biosynthesis